MAVEEAGSVPGNLVEWGNHDGGTDAENGICRFRF
jgi:hypothetical protein